MSNQQPDTSNQPPATSHQPPTFTFYVSRFTQKPGLPTLLVTAVVILYTLIILADNNGDPLQFVIYDGHYSLQIAYRLFDNVDNIPEAYPFPDEVPNAYRYQRILYPLVSTLVAFNQPDLIPWAFLLVNILAIAGGTWITELILRHYGVSHWYSLVYGLFAGQFVALRSDMNEPLAQGLVQLGIYLWLQKRSWGATAVFALAILTKETALIFLAGFMAWSFFQQNWRQLLTWGVAILPYIAYQLFLWQWKGEFGFSSGQPFIWMPFGGWLSAIEDGMARFWLISILLIPIAVIPTLAGLVISLWGLWQRRNHPLLWSILFHAVFMLFLPHLTYREPSAVIRVVQGLAISILLYGALIKSSRLLNYSLLWLFSNVIVIKGTG